MITSAVAAIVALLGTLGGRYAQAIVQIREAIRVLDPYVDGVREPPPTPNVDNPG